MGSLRRSLPTTPLPWGRPRHEALLIALVGIATLALVLPVGSQDLTRMCLTQALVRGHLSADDCFAATGDRSSYHGHLYSNKAPGLSVLSIPAEQVVGLPSPGHWHNDGDARLWAVRVLTSGIAMLLCVFLVGRVSEGLAPGWGGAALVTFGLGTLAASFAASCFDHVPTAALGFAAFVLAASRRPLLAGLAAGTAMLVEYEAAAIVLVLGAYVVLLGGRPLLRYAAGVLPGTALLAGYGWLAFGAPWHNPLSYSDNLYRASQTSGLLGIHLPYRHATRLVLVGDRGLLVVSPVLLCALLGLWRLWRSGRRPEVIVCSVIAAAFLIANCGYFNPYGGDSPGPRFFVPALPFLALGLAPAFARIRVLTALLAGCSILASTAIALTWPSAANSATGYRQTVWGELARALYQGSGSQLAGWFGKTVFAWADLSRLLSASIVFAAAAIAFATALRSGRAASSADAALP